MKIVRFPHPALRYPAAAVTLIDNEVRKVIDALRDLMYQHEGLGLAAPQIAMPIQVFVMNPTGDLNQPEQERIYINPVISQREGNEEREEGCLSFPELYQKVRRPAKVRIKAYDASGATIDEVVDDLVAHVVQHETDHLHGKLFIDYFGPIAKLASRGTLGTFETDFKRAEDRGDYPSKKEILRQLRALEDQFASSKPPHAAVI